MINIARLYYKEGWTQRNISKELGLSPASISTLLSKATDKGLVEVTVHDPFDSLSSLEEKMKDKFNLNHINIISGPFLGDGSLVMKLGMYAALFLQRILRRNHVVGISGGSTLSALATSDMFNTHCPAKIVPIIGGVSATNYSYTSNAIAAELANQIGGTYKQVPYPTYVGLPETREAIIKDESARFALEIAKNAEVMVVGIGAPPFDVLGLSNVDEKEHEFMEKSGIVAEVGGHFLNQEGKITSSGFDKRLIGVEFEDIKNAPMVIAVAGGESKAKAIKATLSSGIIDTIIIDEPTALKIIEDD